MLVIVGVRHIRTVLDDGEFFCPECGGDRRYQYGVGRRWFMVAGLPMFPVSKALGSVRCAVCRIDFARPVLSVPTARRLTSLLREATRSLAVAALVAGGETSPAARAAAVAAVREAGLEGYGEAALASDLCTREGDEEAVETLDALADHLAPEGCARLIAVAARIAVADGPYRTLELDMLLTAGNRLGLTRPEIDRVLDEAAGHMPL
jgi:hypothetical protein